MSSGVKIIKDDTDKVLSELSLGAARALTTIGMRVEKYAKYLLVRK